jgi:hypothetical protein
MMKKIISILLATAVLAIAISAPATARSWFKIPDKSATARGSWVEMPGKAKDIGIGANGAVWVIGANRIGNDWGIFRWNGTGWDGVPGAGTRISVDWKGNAWIINSMQDLYRWDGSGTWINMGIKAVDVGLGADGTAWAIGTERVGYYDWAIHKYGPNGWERMPGGGVAIDVDPKGHALIVNSQQDMYRWDGYAWHQLPGKATDVGVGADGTVWSIGANGGINRLDRIAWRKVAGDGYRIAVDPNGLPWIVKSNTGIFQLNLAAAGNNYR